MPQRSYRVAICGSNYGRAYLSACAASDGRYRPAALLARGSRRSRELAAAAGLPLCRTVDELPGSIDLACLALPSEAAPGVAGALVERRIHLLWEHPQTVEALTAVYAAADERSIQIQVNSHFGDLPAPAAFAARCAARRAAGEAPRLIRVTTQERGLWAALEIAGAALGRLRPRSLARAHAGDGWATVVGRLAEVPASLLVQTPGPDAADGSAAYLFDLRLETVFDRGVLTLPAVAGPLLWSANYSRFGASEAPLWEATGGPPPSGQTLAASRVAANLAALDRLAGAIDGCRPAERACPASVLATAAAWEEIGRLLR